MNKFEKLIEFIINDEDQKARDLFHTIVVEKSRDIYESIMDEENMEEHVHGDQVGDMVDEISNEETMGENDEEGAEAELSGDEEGFAGDEFGGEQGDAAEHEEIEDKVMNIDAKLDELLAKFDEIMGDEGHGEEVPAEEPAMDTGAEEMPAEEPAMFEGENPFAKGSGKSGSAQSGKSGSAKSGKSGKSGSGKMESKGTAELMREYVDKIQDMNLTGASEGDAVGAAGKKTSVNDKSITGPGADFGGNVIKRTGADNATPDGTSAPSSEKPQEIKSGNRNVPGGKADSLESTGKEYSKEHGAEGQTTDGKVAVATKSVQKQNTGVKK